MWQKPQIWWGWSSKISWLLDFCSSKLLLGKCWLLTSGISLLAKDQKAIHRDKKSLIKGSGRLWPRLQQTCFASKCMHSSRPAKLFLNFANFAEHCTVYSIIHRIHSFQDVFTQASTHEAHIPSEYKKSDWVMCHRQKWRAYLNFKRIALQAQPSQFLIVS